MNYEDLIEMEEHPINKLRAQRCLSHSRIVRAQNVLISGRLRDVNDLVIASDVTGSSLQQLQWSN